MLITIRLDGEPALAAVSGPRAERIRAEIAQLEAVLERNTDMPAANPAMLRRNKTYLDKTRSRIDALRMQLGESVETPSFADRLRIAVQNDLNSHRITQEQHDKILVKVNNPKDKDIALLAKRGYKPEYAIDVIVRDL